MSPAPKFTPLQQENLILDASAKCIEASSLLDFTMSSISKECGLSMGSIYKHIQSKEDVLVALATQVFNNLFQVYKQVLSFPIPIAERILAVHMINFEKVSLHSFDIHLQTLVSNEAVLQRASPGWLQKLVQADEALEALFKQTLIAEYEAGELLVKAKERDEVIEEIQVGQWSLNVGFMQVAMQRHARHLVNVKVALPFPLGPDDAIIKSASKLMNTFPWKTSVTHKGLVKVCKLLEREELR